MSKDFSQFTLEASPALTDYVVGYRTATSGGERRTTVQSLKDLIQTNLTIAQSQVTNLVSDLAAKEPTITAGTTAQYWRGDKSFQTLNQAAVAGLTTADSPVFATVRLSGLTSNGFLKTGSGNGTLSVDTTSYLPASSYAAANPTASVGLSAVNGSAVTYMRSDAAPALDQSIAPTWTGVHTHTNNIIQTGSLMMLGGSPGSAFNPNISGETANLDLTGTGGIGILGQLRQNYSLTLASGANVPSLLYVSGTPNADGTSTSVGLRIWGQMAGSNNSTALSGLSLNTVNASTATITTATGLSEVIRIYSSGSITTAYGVLSGASIISSGNISGSFNGFYVSPASYTSTGRITGDIRGLYMPNQSASSSDEVYGVYIEDQTKGGGNAAAFRGAISAASGKYNLYMDGTAQNYLAGVTGVGVAPASTSYLTLGAATTSLSSLNVPHGTAPSSPVNGDVWTTTSGMYARINGSTVGPFGTGGGTTPGYALFLGTGSTSPNDSTAYYFGALSSLAATVSSGVRRVYIPKTGTIKVAQFTWFGSSAAGSGENLTLEIRLNNTTNTTIATIGDTNAYKYFSNTGLSISVSQGDYIEITFTGPAWATNPTGVVIGGHVYIEI